MRKQLTGEQMGALRHKRLEVINAVACPLCKQPIGFRCKSMAKIEKPSRVSTHKERVKAFNKSTK